MTVRQITCMCFALRRENADRRLPRAFRFYGDIEFQLRQSRRLLGSQLLKCGVPLWWRQVRIDPRQLVGEVTNDALCGGGFERRKAIGDFSDLAGNGGSMPDLQ